MGLLAFNVHNCQVAILNDKCYHCPIPTLSCDIINELAMESGVGIATYSPSNTLIDGSDRIARIILQHAARQLAIPAQMAL